MKVRDRIHVDERNPRGTERLQGAEMEKVERLQGAEMEEVEDFKN